MRNLTLALLASAALLACKPDAPPPPEKLPESCDNLAKQYLKCISGSAEPKQDTVASLQSQITARCGQKPDTQKALSACTNAPCEEIDACLQKAQKTLDEAATPAPATP